jgi:hypothetical protein
MAAKELPIISKERVCIYCSLTADIASFNKEHVLSESLVSGLSMKNNLTLAPEIYRFCVCKICNAKFGESIDQVFARDSLEAILRSEKGLIKPKKGKPPQVIGHGRSMRIQNADGVHFDIRHEKNERVIVFHPHVKISNPDTGILEIVSIDNLRDAMEKKPDLEIFCVNCGDEEYSKIASIAKEFGRNLDFGASYKLADVQSEQQPVVITSNIDINHMRAVAKMAFNYAALNLQEINKTLILNACFNPVKAFIMTGEGGGFVEVLPTSLESRREAHSIRVESINGHLRATLIFFGLVQYQVVLAGSFVEGWDSVAVKHVWDLQKMLCYQEN